ncbi:MAG: hypothetical protein QFC55_08795 [Chloroflexota bacterium]|nr:hypothetical protein [Chloroflexota bacterium]
MTRGVSVVRLVLGVIGGLMLLGGMVLAFSGIPGIFVSAFWLIPSGAVLVIVALIEVSRYRSASAELGGGQPGPGGGEPAPLDARFHRTDEVFVDPTSKRTMRVFVDANTGERRYIAEG